MKTIYPNDYNGSEEYFLNPYLRLKGKKKISDLGDHKDFTEAINIYCFSRAKNVAGNMFPG